MKFPLKNGPFSGEMLVFRGLLVSFWDFAYFQVHNVNYPGM